MNRRAFIILLLGATTGGWYYMTHRQSADQQTSSTVTIALEGNPISIDPINVQDVHSSQVATTVHAPLGWVGQNGTIVPMVAQKMEMAADGKTLIVTLNPDASFWNDAPVKPDDVIYSLERYRKSQNLHRWILDRVAGVKEFDDKTAEHVSGLTSPAPSVVQISFAEPEPDAALMLCNLSVAIVQKGSGEAAAKPFGTQVIGCGPYAPGEFEPSLFHCKLRKPTAGKPAELVFRVIPDDAARIAAVRNGEANLVRLRGPMIAEVTNSGVGSLQPKANMPGTQVGVFKANELCYSIFNWASPKLASVPEADRRNLVLALSQAVDRARLVSELFPAGCAEATASIAPPSAGAAALPSLSPAPAGVTFPTGLVLVSANDSASRQLAIAVQKQLQAKGIIIQTEFVDLGALIGKLIKKEFDLMGFWIELQIASSGPTAWCSFFHKGAPLSVFGEARSDVGALLAEARGTLDPAQRAQAYRNVVSTIDERQSSWLPLLSRKAITIQRNGTVPWFDVNGTPVNGLIQAK